MADRSARKGRSSRRERGARRSDDGDVGALANADLADLPDRVPRWVLDQRGFVLATCMSSAYIRASWPTMKVVCRASILWGIRWPAPMIEFASS